MHVVLYTFNRFAAEAEAHADTLRAEGHSVSMRNARYFDGKVEKCDLCVCDWSAERVDAAYRAAGVRVETMRAPAVVSTPPDIQAPRRSEDAVARPTQARRKGVRKVKA